MRSARWRSGIRTRGVRGVSPCYSRLPGGRWIDSSNAPDPSDLSVLPQVRVTHPFHPWAGRELEFVKRRHNWRADRVYVRDDAGVLASLPAEWTDAVPEDPFVVVASGRAPFHLEGLLALAELVASLVALRSSAEDRAVPSD